MKIDKELLKMLLAIADAYGYLHQYRDVIDCLKNDNGFDKVMVHNFLEDEQEIVDWLETWRENNSEWFSSFSED